LYGCLGLVSLFLLSGARQPSAGSTSPWHRLLFACPFIAQLHIALLRVFVCWFPVLNFPGGVPFSVFDPLCTQWRASVDCSSLPLPVRCEVFGAISPIISVDLLPLVRGLRVQAKARTFPLNPLFAPFFFAGASSVWNGCGFFFLGQVVLTTVVGSDPPSSSTLKSHASVRLELWEAAA